MAIRHNVVAIVFALAADVIQIHPDGFLSGIRFVYFWGDFARDHGLQKKGIWKRKNNSRVIEMLTRKSKMGSHILMNLCLTRYRGIYAVFAIGSSEFFHRSYRV